MAKRYIAWVQLNTDTNNHDPLCSLFDEGYKAVVLFCDNVNFATYGIQVDDSVDEAVAKATLANHPAIMMLAENIGGPAE